MALMFFEVIVPSSKIRHAMGTRQKGRRWPSLKFYESLSTIDSACPL